MTVLPPNRSYSVNYQASPPKPQYNYWQQSKIVANPGANPYIQNYSQPITREDIDSISHQMNELGVRMDVLEEKLSVLIDAIGRMSYNE